MQPLTLMLVHAHPDDETFSTGGTIALYHDRGVQIVNVTCTGGEQGEIVDPELDTPENHANLATIRQAELAMAGEILGIDVQEYLGFCDSGMAGTEANANPVCFHQSSLEEATERLVCLIRQYRPHVLVTYDENGSYGHPDHIKAHLVTVRAWASAGNPEHYHHSAAPWQPQKLYYVGQPRERMLRMWRTRQARGEKTPLDDPNFDPQRRGIDDDRVTTKLDVAAYVPRKIAALRAHRTQVRLDHPNLQADPIVHEYMGTEFYVLVQGPRDESKEWEDDLFAGVA